MSFLPDILIKYLKKAMDSRENLHVVSLGNANFSAAMSNVDRRKDCVLRTPDPLKPGLQYWIEYIFRKDVIPLGY